MDGTWYYRGYELKAVRMRRGGTRCFVYLDNRIVKKFTGKGYDEASAVQSARKKIDTHLGIAYRRAGEM